MTPYSKYGTTPSKSKKSSFKTQEKYMEPEILDFGFLDFGEIFGTSFKEVSCTTANKFPNEDKRPSINFALGSLEEDTIDRNKYASLNVSRNQLQNIRQCKYCNIIFDKLDYLRNHTVKHFDSELFSILPNTMERRCPSCRKKFPSYNFMKQHYGKEHYCSDEDLSGILLWAELGKVTLYFPVAN
jgi:hypothetical protein